MHQTLPRARAFANSSACIAVEYRGGKATRHFEISPGTFSAIVGTLVLLFTLSIASGLYIFSRDEILRSVLSGQAKMQYAYEDRIAQLRAHIDRVAGRQLADQDTVEAKLHELINRQVQLESRQALVARITDEAARVGIALPEQRPAARTPQQDVTGNINAFMPLNTPGAQPLPRAKPMPEEPGLRTSTGPSDSTPKTMPLPPPRLTHIDRRTLPLMLEQAQTSATMMATMQMAQLRGIEGKAQISAKRFRSMIDNTGLDVSRFIKGGGKAAPETAMGGPLVPLKNAEAAQFEKSLAAAQAYLDETERLSRVIETLPVRRPLPKTYETTSGFGARSDPFTRGLAMHAGLDFRAATGTPARATGNGRVIEADWVGGYGRMVEIDHGHGLTTRYAHLSAIDVKVGDTVRRGDVVGLVGSSGRSTGPHLHYEVRIDDEAVDPVTFLRAGERAAIH